MITHGFHEKIQEFTGKINIPNKYLQDPPKSSLEDSKN